MPLHAEERIQEFVNGHIHGWEGLRSGGAFVGRHLPVITVSMEPGSDGSQIAKLLADWFGFDYFHRELLEVVASDAKVSSKVIEKLEKDRLSGIQDLISQIMDTRYLHTEVYQEHLEKIVRTIGRRGYGVIVGRGANFILPPEERLAVRIVAPEEHRIKRISKTFSVLPEDAQKRIRNREEKRALFIKKTFKHNIGSPAHYDLLVNTGMLTRDAAARLICTAWLLKFFK